MRDGGEMEDRVILERGVKAGVIAKRTFRPHLARLHITFEDEINVARDFQLDGLARDKLD